ncbi:uncharacterized protein ALTATR162_LOCUS4951 [Alternaria atra]|uniref:Uncharacterized protein n=1 Tax=Alternaria atra TaxID=119953 RepID=A0A8J2I0T0_9PLEO|nr:uncharacterized protein ALTATR162_LOCUS4951 [Alternaria atra]CAG5157159.1 unnamed protein product [Alternaria atra]
MTGTTVNIRQQRYDRSSSVGCIEEPHLSLQEIEPLRWDRALESSVQALHETMNSPAYWQFPNNTASMWTRELQDVQGTLSRAMKGGEGSSGVQSPSSDTTVKLGNGGYGHSGSLTSSSVANVTVITPEVDDAQTSRTSELENPLSLHSRPLAGISNNPSRRNHFDDPNQTYAKHNMGVLPPGLAPPVQIHAGTSLELFRFAQNPIRATFDDAALHLSNFSNPLGSPNDLHVPLQMNLHQRRFSGRMSSLPSIPSPLGPGRTREQLREDEDGGVLLSSVPNGAVLRDYKMGCTSLEGNATQMKKSMQRKRVPSSPKVQQYVSTGSMHIPPVFDVYPPSAQIKVEGNIFSPLPGFVNGPGHSRKYTDPFIDHEPTQNDSAYVNYTRLSGTATPFRLSSQSSMCLPPTPLTATWPTSASATFRLACPPTLAFAPPQSLPASRGRPPMRSNLTILLPPLSSIQGRHQHTPEARARLEAQRPNCEEWICIEAAKIAQLARLRHAAERRYRETHAEQDYKSWQQIEVVFADATNLEKRQEERRNLFLNEKGMTALRTPKIEDMSAASRERGGKDGEEKLLGFKMALMERECVEVKRDEDEEAITVEMLATLSLEEKKALRKHLVRRLERRS